MYRFTLIALLCMITCPVATAQNLIITGGQLFDSVADDLRPNRGIAIVGGKFAIVDEVIDAARFADAPRLELGDEDTILPGLFDLHAHYNIRVAGLGRIDETEHYAAIYLANGCTSTFPAGEYNPESMMAMRLRIDRGEQVGPRVYNSGPYYGQSMRRGANAQEVFDRVDTWAANGARGFKAKRISPLQLEALIERAHLHGMTVTAHLDSGFRNSVNPRDAILMGIDRIEHFLGGDLLPDAQPAYSSLENLTDADIASPAMDAIIELFLERGVFFDATLTAYGYFGKRDEVYDRWHDESKYMTPYVREWAAGQEHRVMEQFEKIYHVKHKTLKRFYESGGGALITTGTDHVSGGDYLGGFAIHRELHAFVRAGIAPADALKMATINGARALNVSDKLGTIVPGKFADLCIITGDPLADIRATRNVRTVVKSGVMHDAAELLKSVEGTMGPDGPVERGEAES